jgi:hypothetical protein
MPKSTGSSLKTIKNDVKLRPIPVVVPTSSREGSFGPNYALPMLWWPVEFHQFITAVKELVSFGV